MLRKGLRLFFGTVRYTKSHEWVESLEGGRYRVGITNHAQGELGELVHIQHPAIGKQFEAGTGVVTIESVKTTADVYTPSKGKLVGLNQQVIKNPSAINQNADKAWIFEVICETPPTHLIQKAQYQKFLEETKH